MVDLDQTLIHTTEQHCQRMSNKVLSHQITLLYCHHCDGETDSVSHMKLDCMHQEYMLNIKLYRFEALY